MISESEFIGYSLFVGMPILMMVIVSLYNDFTMAQKRKRIIKRVRRQQKARALARRQRRIMSGAINVH